MSMNQNMGLAQSPLACVILAAGQGTRMKSTLPKVMHAIANKPMVLHVVQACESLGASKIVVVVAPNMDGVCAAVAPYDCATQEQPLGTGDAVKASRKALEGFDGDVLVLFGDTPLVTPLSLQRLVDVRNETGASIVVSGFQPKDPSSYGRLVCALNGELDAIVEAKDATEEQLKIGLCNGGLMLFEGKYLWTLLNQIKDVNAKKEYYLTDAVALARAAGLHAAVAFMDEDDVRGINTRLQLAEAENIMQDRLRKEWLLSGVTMTDPSSVFLSADTQLGQDVIIGPNVVFGAGVSVGANVEIKPFCHLEKVEVASGAIIGPFARLRPGASIGAGAHIGNFVEIKNATIEAGAKVNHLTYIGDARIGEKANIGAGTITCNYDGFTKSHTDIGAGAFIGSNTSLVAPLKIGDGAIIGAGSTITKDVPSDALAVTRAKPTLLEGWASRFRAQKSKV